MLERARLGMAMFLLSQAVFFLFLLIGVVYFRESRAGSISLLYTACLLASIFTMWRATADNPRQWLVATIFLGGAFLWGEYWSAMPTRSVATALFTLVGCHELYTAVGIVVLGLALWRSAIVRTVALYWYFVVAVWFAIVAVAWGAR